MNTARRWPIGVRSDCFPPEQQLRQTFDDIKLLGYDFLEFVLPADWPVSVASSAELNLLADAAQLPVRSTSTAAFVWFGKKSPEDQAAVTSGVADMLAFTRAIGADTMLLAISEDPFVICPRAFETAISCLADVAAGVDVTIAVEPVAGLLPETIGRLVERVEQARVKMYFDVGNCYYVGEDPIEQIELLGPFVHQVHLKGGPQTPLASVPLPSIAAALVRHDFGGRLCLEIAATSTSSRRNLLDARTVLRLADLF